MKDQTMATPDPRWMRSDHGTYVEQNQMQPGYTPPSASMRPGPAASPTPSPTPPPAPQQKRPHRILIALIAFVALLILGGIALGIAVSGSAPAAKSNATTPVEEHPAGAPLFPDLPDLPTTEPTAAPGPTLAASDVTLTLKTTSKQCYGSAGCNVEVKVRMAYDGPALSDDDTWEVTYVLTGDEAGPITNSFEVTGDQYTVNEELLSTKSSKTKLKVKVTSVEKIGI